MNKTDKAQDLMEVTCSCTEAENEHVCNTLQSVLWLSHILLFETPWTAARQASLSITNSRGLLRLMYIESVMPSNHLILCHPLSSCLQSFPASGSLPTSQFYASGGQSIGVSASASGLPVHIQAWLIFFRMDWCDLAVQEALIL